MRTWHDPPVPVFAEGLHDVWSLLRDLDDPHHVECPADYNHRMTRERFNALAAALDKSFACACGVDRHVEDASHHGRIDIPADACVRDEHITVVVSNFGNLAVMTAGNPGSFDELESERVVDQADWARVAEILGELGYTVVPEHPLWTRYDGNVEFLREQRHTWWDRYFCYL